MKYIYVILINFCLVNSYIQSMYKSQTTNERPYSLSSDTAKKLHQCMWTEFENDILTDPKCNYFTQTISRSSTNHSLPIHGTQEYISATVDIYSHTYIVTIETLSTQTDMPNHLKFTKLTKIFSMNEFCAITGTQGLNTGSFYR